MTAGPSAGANRLAVKVTPNAGRNEISGLKDGVLQVKLAAPPDKGRANKELVDFLSESLGVRKSAIAIIRGHTGRHKIIEIEGTGREEALKRLLKRGKGEGG
jgi:uncharacterized protein (TIGR00251 family)